MLRRIALAAALIAIAAAIAVGGRAWHQFSSSDIQSPEQPRAAFRRTLRHRPRRILAGRDRRLRRKAAARSRRRHLPSSPGTSGARSSRRPRRPLALPAGVRRARRRRRPARPRPGRSAAVVRRRGLAGARGRPRELCAALLAARSPSRSAPAIDWFWQIAALGAIFFLATGVAGRGALRASWRRARRANGTGGAAALQAGDRRPGAGLDRSAGADRAAAGRPRDRRQQLGGGRRQPAERGQPRRTRALDRALGASPYKQLGLLAEPKGNYPAAIGRLRPGDRTRRGQLAPLLPAGAGSRARPATKRPPQADLGEAQRLNPEEKCLAKV